MPKKHTTETFIERAKLIHGNRYDYSESVYINSCTPIRIVCKRHGSFEQKAGWHLLSRGSGCIECANEQRNIKRKITIQKNENDKVHELKEFFIKNLTQRYSGYKFEIKQEDIVFADISVGTPNFHYSFTNVTITCKNNHIFTRTLSFLRKTGRKKLVCHECKLGRNIESVRIRINKIHPDHNLDLDHIKLLKNRYIELKCNEHGIFQIQRSNLFNGWSCPPCVSKYKKQHDWIKSFENSNIIPNYELVLEGTRYKFDGFDSLTNTVYEFYGDFWHGNPKIYRFDDIHPHLRVTFGFLYSETLTREQKLKDFGFNIISAWES